MYSIAQALKISLQMLSRRDRIKYLMVTAAQMATAFMDLAGVLLLGAVASSAIAGITGNRLPALTLPWGSTLELSNATTLLLAALAAGSFLVFKTLINVLLTRRILFFLASRQATISRKLVSRLMARSLLEITAKSTQTTAYALTTGVNMITMGVLAQAVIAATEVALLLTLFVGLLFLSPELAIIGTMYFLALGGVLHLIITRWAYRLGAKSQSLEVGSLTAVQEALRSYREIIVGGRAHFFVGQIGSLRSQFSFVQANMSLVALIPKYVFEIGLVLGGALLMFGLSVRGGLVEAAGMVAIFVAAGSRLVPSILRFQGSTLAMRNAIGMSGETFELAQRLGLRHEGTSEGIVEFPLYQKVNSEHQGFLGTLDVRNVTLTYPGAQFPALINVTFSIEHGQSLAIVGPTGSGKSTLADVLLGLLEPEEGTVRISGQSPQSALRAWPGAVAYVPQEIQLTAGSFRENVAFGIPADLVDDAQIMQVLEVVDLAALVRSRRGGLGALVGENGMKLSGGQRQRIGLARALYSQPRLIVLDEATSSLDVKTESVIVKALSGLEGQVTTAIIAHRLTTVRHANKVLYIREGRLQALGSFDEVMTACPDFAQDVRLSGLL